MANTKTVYEFTKGQKTHLDSIYSVMGLAGGDWWQATDPRHKSGDEEAVTITRSIKIEITVTQ